MSKQKKATSRKLTQSSLELEKFLKEAPLKYSSELHNGEKREILGHVYNSLWDADVNWMDEYFTKDSVYENNNITEHYHEPSYSHTSKQCGHVFKRNETIFRCRNCGLDDTCVLCSSCFQSTQHEGHDITIRISSGSGGCCDCGDPEAWKVPLYCGIHSVDTTQDHLKKPISHVPPQLLQSVRDTISVVFDYILETFATSSENLSTTYTSKDIKSECIAAHKALDLPGITNDQTYVCILWNDEDHNFDAVISIVEQAFNATTEEARHAAECVDQHGRCSIEYSKSLKHLVKGAKKISNIGLAVSITSVEKKLREDIAGLLLQWLNELVTEKTFFFGNIQEGNCIIQDIIHDVLFEDWALRPKLARLSVRQRKKKPSSREEVINISEDEASIVEISDQNDDQNTINLLNESEIDSESDDDTMDNIQALLYQVGTEEERESDASHSEEEDMWDLANGFIRQNSVQQERNTLNGSLDMLLGRLSGTDRSGESSKKRKISYSSTNKKNARDVGDIDWQLEDWLKKTEEIDFFENSSLNINERQFTAPSDNSRAINDINLLMEFRRKLRLDYLLLYDLRLWKTARDDLKDLYIATLNTNPKYRIELGKRFVRSYPDIVNALFFKDREIDYSISKLSIQLLTAPTVASVLVTDYRFFSMVLTIATNYFLKHEVLMRSNDEYNNVQVDCSSKAASSAQSCYYLFQSLRFIMDIKQNQLEFASTPLHLAQFLDFISHFQSMDPLRRKANVHVEYESESWTNAFNLNKSIAKLCRLFATFFDALGSEISTVETAHHLSRSIRRVLHTILHWDPRILTVEGVRESSRLVKGIRHLDYHAILSPSAGLFWVVDYNVATSPVSFHHPLHWLLSKLLENTYFLQDNILRQVGWNLGLDQMIQSTFDTPGSNQFLKVIEYPLRTLTLLSQISCGVWVRNGHNVAVQLHNYRSIGFRTNTLDNDIYLLQVGFTLCDRNQILLTLIDRFQLLHWFYGSPFKTHPIYDDTQTKYMVEDLLNLLITIATEHDKLSNSSKEHRVRQFILQYLALSNLTFSELLKMIPNNLNDGCFETYLNEMATFKPPTGLDDRGLYELKPEYMNQLNPYFWYYSRNQREEAQETLRKHYNSLNPNQPLKENDEFIFLPQLSNQSSLGPFKEVTSFLHSHVFCEIITYSLLNYKDYNDCSNDSILDQTFHLAILAAMDSERIRLERERGTKETLSASHWVPVPAFIDNATNDKIPVQQQSIHHKKHVTLLTVLFSYICDHDRLSHTHKRVKFLIDKIEVNGSSDTKQVIEELKQSYMIVNSSATNTNNSPEMSEYERKKAAAKARQAAIMSQIANAQAQFMQNHSEMYDDDEEEEGKEEDYNDHAMDISGSTDNMDDDLMEVTRMCHFPTDTCIVCQEQLNENQLFGVLAFVQNSNIQRLTPSNNKEIWADILHASENVDPYENKNREERAFKGFPTELHIKGMEISSCNHMMHADCFSRYQDTTENLLLDELRRVTSQAYLNGRYLCPLCKSIGNTLIPIIWKGKKETYPGVLAPCTPFSQLEDNALNLLTELNLKIEEIHYPDYNSTPFKNQDNNIFLNDVKSLKDLYHQLNMTICKVQSSLPDDSNSNNIDLSLLDFMNNLYSIYASTISKFEISQRGNAGTKARDPTVEYTGTLMDDIPMSAQTFLKMFGMTNDFIPKLMTSTWDVYRMMVKESLARVALKKVFPNDFSIFNTFRPLLLEDPFETLVLLGFSTNEYPQLEPHHILRTMYIAELTKIVYTLFQSVMNGEDMFRCESISSLLNNLNHHDASKEKVVVDFVHYVLGLLNTKNDMVETFLQIIQPGAMLSLIRTFILPFIRKSLVFMVVFHGLILQTPDNRQMSEYDYLLDVLRLPYPEAIFEFQATENNLIPGWCKHFIIFNTSSAQSRAEVLGPLKLFLPIQHKLVTLPYRLDGLFEESLKRVCSKCNTVPEYSAICLICGQFVCARRFCCTENERGECNNHMRTCGGEIGMYLIIKDCFVLLLHQDGGGTIMGAPYLDSHGEPDIFLKRGTPQYLNTKRYEQLQQMWVNQTVATYVRRSMDTINTTASWEYF